MTYFNETEIRKTIEVMKPDNELFEIRIVDSSKKAPAIGYFKDVDVLIDQLKKQNLKGKNVYISLNEPNEACYARKQKDCFVDGATTTGDKDVIGYDWLMIDLDPQRPSGVSSSDEELKGAKALGNKIYQYLSNLGFEKPLTAFSGNGVHLLYKVFMENNSDNEELIKNCLKALNILFGNENVKVDCANFNPSRVCKLYGTLAQKGANTTERPHRMSMILGNADNIKVNDKSFLEKLSNVIPKAPEKAQRYNNFTPSEFDLEDWLFKYGLNYRKVSEKDYDKYVLDVCPFDSTHKAPDACIFKTRNGAIGFHCFHNSCSDKTWQDVRVMYEPEAYDRKRQYIEKQMYRSFNRDLPKEPKVIKEDETPIEYTPAFMKKKPKPIRQYIKTGIADFDRLFIGLEKKQVTLLSGYSGGSKSTLLSQIMLNAIDAGNRVYCFSGELDEDDLYSWLILQAAGKSNTEETKPGFYQVKDEARGKILDWLEGKFWLYNNDKGYNFEAIINHLSKRIKELKIDLLCIDNLMAMDIADLGDTKNDQQKAFVWMLHELAIRENIHIIIVCHPKKPIGLLTLYDVSGASEIVNTADNIVYVYRVTQQFTNAYAAFFKHNWVGDCTNVWHIAKTRHGSITDDYMALYYEPETKRLKGNLTDNKVYGWDNEFHNLEDLEIPF